MGEQRVRIPAEWADVDPAWMTEVLGASFPGTTVDGVELLLVDDGTNRRARVGLSYATGDGPDTVFLKAADPAHAALNAATGGVLNEPRLFVSGVDLPVLHPEVYRAVIDEPALDFLLVMEDVTGSGGDPRDATRPLSADQAASGVVALASLHSRFWGHRVAAEPALSWVEPLVAWGSIARGVDIGIERAGDRLPDEVARLGGEQIDRGYWLDYMATVTQGPQTLLHGDPHIGNTYVLPGDEVGFLDWQVVHTGAPTLDLGYFLQGAVTIDDRQEHERDLVRLYLESLDLPQDDLPAQDDLWRRYRASSAHGLALWLATAASRWQRPEVSLALAERYAAAFVDLQAPEAISELRR